jgi:hypothetical protein
MTTTSIATLKNGPTPPARPDEREPVSGKPAPSFTDLSAAARGAKEEALAKVEGPKAPTLPVDLVGLCDEVLALLAEEVPREQQRRQAQREADLFAEMKERARLLGVPHARLAAALGVRLAPGTARPSTPRPVSTEPAASGETPAKRDRRHDPKPLYWNPKDHSQRWTKKGNQPRWYRDHLAAGGTEEECRIPEGAIPDGGEP